MYATYQLDLNKSAFKVNRSDPCGQILPEEGNEGTETEPGEGNYFSSEVQTVETPAGHQKSAGEHMNLFSLQFLSVMIVTILMTSMLYEEGTTS